MLLGLTLWAPPHAYVNRRWGNPAGTQHSPMLRQKAVHEDLSRADGLRKGWPFRVGTWNADSLTGRLGELVEALGERRIDIGVCRKFSGEEVHVGTLALQAKGISCFGWEVRQKLKVLEYL